MVPGLVRTANKVGLRLGLQSRAKILETYLFLHAIVELARARISFRIHSGFEIKFQNF